MAGLHDVLIVLLVIAFFDSAQTNYCNVESCYGRTHTMCHFSSPAPSRQCGYVQSADLTAQDIQEVLGAHNKYRALVGRGLEKRGVYGGQPAGDIRPLIWDKELAAIAQLWANQCQFKHDSCRNVDRFQVGQNIAYESWGNGWNTKLSDIVKLWYDEVERFDSRLIYNYIFSRRTGHYTQMVWGKTTSIGCGLVKYNNNSYYTTYLVCNYGPAGNAHGERVYEPRIVKPNIVYNWGNRTSVSTKVVTSSSSRRRVVYRYG